MIRTLALALGFAGIAGAALAAPVLKPEVTVVGPIVTVGDMFDEAGDLAAKPLFRAPAPGTSGIVNLEAVRKAATAIGLSDFDDEGVVRVRVARLAVAVEEHILRDLVVGDLMKRGIADGVTVVATFDQTELLFNAEVNADPVTLQTMRYAPQTGVFAARFLIAGRDAPVDLTGRVELMVEAPHLVSNLRAGTVLSEADIVMKQVPLRFAETANFATPGELIGQSLLRQSRAGMLLASSDVGEPLVIARSDVVTIYFRTGPLTLTVKGQALGAAARGQSVDVLNLMSRKVVTGVAIGDGAVEVFAAPASVAAL